ncbi:hypothetical protein BGZ73_001857 [Actinomortierella ambigua]|nr:hypothetical protein BGZ73_001857 [Actinomortierella ambigua]
MCQCHALVSLEAGARNEDEWDMVMNIVKANPRLQALRFHIGSTFYEPEVDYLGLRVALEGLSQMRELNMGCSLPEVTVLHLLGACPSLKHLTLDRLISSETDTSLPQDKQALGLSSLKVQSGCQVSALALLLKRCHDLQTLCLAGSIVKEGLPTYEQMLGGCLQNLTTLALSNHFSSDACEGILSVIPPQQLRIVYFNRTTYRQINLLAEYHFQSLEVLEASIMDHATVNLSCLFTKFQRLRRLKVNVPGNLDIRYIIATSWKISSTIEDLFIAFGVQRVCQDETLKHHAAVEKEQEGSDLGEWQQAERVFMKRLGECTRLRSFISERQVRGLTPFNLRTESLTSSSSSLSWHLSAGLGHLGKLNRLEKLDIGDSEFAPKREDLEFMKEHWPRLRVMACSTLSSDGQTREWLQENWPELRVQERLNLPYRYAINLNR